ncbi:MAG: hypothetical protein WC201_03005 [Bacilli bacterium]
MKKTSLVLLFIGIFGFLSCLIYYIISAIPNFYSDAYGTSIAYGNKDYLIWTMLFLITLFVAIIHIVEEKKKIVFPNVNSISLIVIGLIGAIYYLSQAIETIVDGKISYFGFVIAILFSFITFFGIAIIFDRKKDGK